MTEDKDENAQSNSQAANVKTRSGSAWGRERWENLKSDPDDEADLGYRRTEWEQFETMDKEDQIIFLPGDEAQLKDAEFLVAQSSAVKNLEHHC